VLLSLLSHQGFAMHRIACLTIVALGLVASLMETTCWASNVYTVRSWTKMSGEKFSGRFERMDDTNVVMAVSGTTKFIPLADLSFPDQQFLQAGLAGGTQPLTVPLTPPPAVVVAPPVAVQSAPPAVIAPPVVETPPVVSPPTVAPPVATQPPVQYTPPQYTPPQYVQPQYTPPTYTPPQFNPPQYQPPRMEYVRVEQPNSAYTTGRYTGGAGFIVFIIGTLIRILVVANRNN
jgi:hypothetical protein